VEVGLVTYGLDRPARGISRYTVDLIHALSSSNCRSELDITLPTTSSLAASPIGGSVGSRRLGASRRLPRLMTWRNLALCEAAQQKEASRHP